MSQILHCCGWGRPEATAPIQPLAREPPCAAGAALKRQKTKQTNKQKQTTPPHRNRLINIENKLLSFGIAKETVNKMKRQPID